MPPFRGRSPDPEIARIRRAFAELADGLEAAQRALLAAIPTARDPGVPLAEAIAGFERGLEEVASLMPAWRGEPALPLWETCRKALEEARVKAERLRLDPADPGFEALNARIGDVLGPLEAFADAERALRRM